MAVALLTNTGPVRPYGTKFLIQIRKRRSMRQSIVAFAKPRGDDAMGFFDTFGRAVEHTVSDIAGAVAGVIKTVAGDLENAVKIAENVFSGYIQGVGQVLLVEGKIIVAAYQTLEMLYAELVQDAIG